MTDFIPTHDFDEDQLQERLDKIKKSYEALISSPEERKLYDEFIADRARYVGLSAKIFSASARDSMHSKMRFCLNRRSASL